MIKEAYKLNYGWIKSLKFLATLYTRGILHNGVWPIHKMCYYMENK